MHFQIPGFPLAMTILWIWVGFVVVLVAGWWMLKWWKMRHPPPVPKPVLSNSQQLRKRLNEPPGKRPGHGHRHDRHGK